MSNDLMRLSLLLESESAKAQIKGYRLMFLRSLQQELDSTSKIISDTGLVAGLGTVPPLNKVDEIYSDAARRVASGEDYDDVLRNMGEQLTQNGESTSTDDEEER